jgi:hypothetical protein
MKMPTNFASTTVLSNHIIPAYDRMVTFALREVPSFRALVDRRPANVTNPGDTVQFTWYADMATTTTPLSETVSPDSVAVANPTRTKRHGERVRHLDPEVAADCRRPRSRSRTLEIAELLARQQGDTIDALVYAKLAAGTNTSTARRVYTTAALVRTVAQHDAGEERRPATARTTSRTSTPTSATTSWPSRDQRVGYPPRVCRHRRDLRR